MAIAVANEQLALGTTRTSGGTRFRALAPQGTDLTLVIHDGAAPGAYPMVADERGVFELTIDGAGAGNRYSYRINGGPDRPDPASRFQPDGVHGPSQVIDPTAFAWTDGGWTGAALEGQVVYEMHVGTFTK